MEKIQLLLEALDKEIQAIEHRLQTEVGHNLQWDLLDELEGKRMERASLLSKVYNEAMDGMEDMMP